MKARYRDLTEKYRLFRAPSDALYSSRSIQVLFNKFVKKGKKATSRRHIWHALQNVRFSVRHPRVFNMLTRILRSLRVQFLLLPRRQGRKMIEVPVPVRRNKSDVLNIQALATAIHRRRDRGFYTRWEQEILSLTVAAAQSSTLRQRTTQLAKIYEERVNMDRRWK